MRALLAACCELALDCNTSLPNLIFFNIKHNMLQSVLHIPALWYFNTSVNIPPMISLGEFCCYTTTFCIAEIFVKYCYTTGSCNNSCVRCLGCSITARRKNVVKQIYYFSSGGTLKCKRLYWTEMMKWIWNNWKNMVVSYVTSIHALTSMVTATRTLHGCPSQMNENLMISNSKLTSDSELIWSC